jgi:hypothetical protein
MRVTTAQAVPPMKGIMEIAKIATTVPFALVILAHPAATALPVSVNALIANHAPFVQATAKAAPSAPVARCSVTTAWIVPFATITAMGARTAPVPGMNSLRNVLAAFTKTETQQASITAALWTDLCVHTATALKFLLLGALATSALVVLILKTRAQAVPASAETATTARSVPLLAMDATTALVLGMEKSVWPAETTSPEAKRMMAAFRKGPCVPTSMALWLLKTSPLERFAFLGAFLTALSNCLPIRISDFI